MFSLRSIFIAIAIIACVVFVVTAKYRRDQPSVNNFSAPDGFALVLPINRNEGLAIVGNEVKLKLALINKNSHEIACEVLTQRVQAVRIFWGGTDGVFGFSANGHEHTIPFSYGTSQNSISARLGTGESCDLAVAIDPNGESYSVVVRTE